MRRRRGSSSDSKTAAARAPPRICPDDFAGERWQAIEDEIKELRAAGLTATRSEVEAVAAWAAEQASG